MYVYVVTEIRSGSLFQVLTYVSKSDADYTRKDIEDRAARCGDDDVVVSVERVLIRGLARN